MELLTTTELCAALKVSRTTVVRWRKAGMPHYMLGSSVRFNLLEVLKWFEEMRVNGYEV